MPADVTSPGFKAQTSGAPALASNALPIGTRVGEFEITRMIGEGGFSVVYLAFDHTLHRSIALKEYIPSALASRRGDQTVAVRSAQHQQTFEAGLRSFINEARLLAQFDHPALVKVYRFWEANGTAYMAMPYYEGRTLKETLREHPEKATEAWLKHLLVPLLDALALLHAHHCYHRDIAPDNIQLLDNEQPVLLDFGAARRTIGDMTQAFTVILKPGYAPIEQYAEETDLKQGPWTDVYALSAVLYGAIVGKPPPTAVARVIKDPLEALTARGIAGFDPAFLAGIDCGLAVRPEARPQSIVEWRSQLGMDARAASRAATPAVPAVTDAPDVASHADDETRLQRRAVFPVEQSSRVVPSESDRTVLVPGLRRSPAQPSVANAAPTNAIPSPPPAMSDTSKDVEPRRRMSPPVAIAGIVTVVAAAVVIAWLVIARSSGEHAQPPVVAKADDATQAAAVARSAPAPSSSSHSTPAPASSPPATGSTPAQDAAQLPSPATPEAAQGPAGQHEPEPASDTASRPQPAPVPSKPSPLPDDERRWAAIRDTDDVEDLRAFRRRFPQSPRAQEAAVRIQQLVRQSRENAREAEPPARVQTPPSTIAKAEQAAPSKTEQAPAQSDAAVAARASTPSGTTKGTVRIRVQPFGYVYVDGALIGPSPPARDVQLAPGKHRIEARNEQENPSVIRRDIDVSASGSTDVPLRFRE